MGYRERVTLLGSSGDGGCVNQLFSMNPSSDSITRLSSISL